MSNINRFRNNRDLTAYIEGSLEFAKGLREKDEDAKIYVSTVEGMLERILKEFKRLNE